jgi:hypothetical protein
MLLAGLAGMGLAGPALADDTPTATTPGTTAPAADPAVTFELVKDCATLHGLSVTIHNGRSAAVTVQVTNFGGPVLGSVTVPAGGTATAVLGVFINITDPYDLKYLDAADGSVLAEFQSSELFFCFTHVEYRITVAAGTTYRSDPICPALGASRPAHGTVKIVEDTRYAYTANRGYHGPDQFNLTCITSAEMDATVFVTVVGAQPPPPTHSAAGVSGGGGPRLPDTGVRHLGWLLAAAAGAIALGTGSLVAARR